MKLTQKRIDEVIRKGGEVELRDDAAPGLVFRHRKSGRWIWTLRRTVKKVDRRLDIGSEWSLDEAREIAWDLDRAIKLHNDPWAHQWARRDWDKGYLGKLAVKHGKTPPVLKPIVEIVPSILWEEAVTEYLAEIAGTKKPATAESKRKELEAKEFAGFVGQRVADMTHETIAEALYKIRNRGAERQAETCAIAVRMVFKNCGAAQNRARTGVHKDFYRDIEQPERKRSTGKPGQKSTKKVRIPSGEDVAKIMLFARSTANGMSERDRLAVLLTVYTVQRRTEIATARCDQFTEAHTGGIWTIPPVSRKTATESEERGVTYGFHVVPLPPSAWAVVLRAKELAKGDEWLFPPSDDRTTGLDAVHMNESTVTHAVRKASGGIYSPHDIRRAFGTTYAEVAGIDDEDVGKILDHSEGKKASVTRKHYAFADGTHEKWKLIDGWVAWVDKQVCE
jgi:integrase